MRAERREEALDLIGELVGRLLVADQLDQAERRQDVEADRAGRQLVV